jgi:hypothetical protein
MSTFHPVIRGGPTWLAFLVLAGIAATPAPGGAESPRYTLRGSFEASARSQGSAASMQLSARLSPPARGAGLQAGGDFVVVASVAASPLGCADDTIFVNGFETSG